MTITNGGPASMFRLNAVTVQHLMDTIAGKPGASLDDVAAALQLVAAGVNPAELQALVDAAVGGLQGGGVVEAAVAAATAPLVARIDALESTLAAVLAAFNPPSATGDITHVSRFVNNVTAGFFKVDQDLADFRDGFGELVAAKAETTYVDAELAKKDAELAQKADKTQLGRVS